MSIRWYYLIKKRWEFSRESKIDEKWLRKVWNFANNINQSHANIHATGILSHQSQNRYKMSKMIYLYYRLSTFCEARSILLSDHWETTSDLKYYDINGIANKVRISTYGFNTLKNIFQSIGAEINNLNLSINLVSTKLSPPDTHS